MKKSFNLIRTVSIGIMLTLWSLLISAGSVAHAQDITLTLPDTSGIAGDTLRVPLRVSPLQASDAVTSGEFHLSYDAGIVELVGYETLNTLLEGQGSVLLNQRGDRLAFAGTDTVAGSGTLIILNFLINPSATYNEQSELAFSSARLNEGAPATTSADGNLRVQGIRISPRGSNTQVIEGDSLQFSLSGDIHPPAAWEVSDTSIATIDANGWLRAKKPGLIRVKATDNVGLADSTERFRVQAATLSSLAITIPDRSARQTLEVEIPVQVSDVTGLNIRSSETTISYDARYLEFLSIDNSGTMTGKWGDLTINSNIAGQLSVAGAGTDTLAGAGTLFTMLFRVRDRDTGNSTIAIEESIFNESINASNVNGTFTALAAPAIQVNYSDTTLSIGDRLSFSVTGGEGTSPYTWSTSAPAVASIDANTGELEALSRGNALITATDAEGFPSERIDVRVNDFDAYLDTVAVSHTDTAVVTLQAGDFTGKGVLSYEMAMQYDTGTVRFLDVETAGTLSEPLSVQVRAHEDTLELAAAGTSAFSGSAPIVKLHFALRDDVITEGEFARLDLLQLQFNEPGPGTPTATLFPGGIQVGTAPQPAIPVLASPADQAAGQPVDLTLSWHSAAGADTYRLQIAHSSGFSSIVVDTSGLADTSFVAAGALQYDSTYYWRVLASGAGGSSAFTAPYSFTVITSNPRLVHPLADQNASEGQPFTYVVPADAFADADDATLSLSASLDNGDPLPSWLSFDPATRTFSGTPDHMAGGAFLYRIRVTAEDQDGATASDVFELQVSDVNVGPVLISAIGDTTIDEDSGPMVLSADVKAVFRDTVDNDPLSFSVTVHGHGISAYLSNDSLYVEPAPDFFGVDSLTLAASDGALSESVKVIVTVDPVNDLPEFTALPDTVSFAVDSSATLPLFDHLSDVETALENMVLDFSSDQRGIDFTYDNTTGELQLSSTGYTGVAWLRMVATDEDGGAAIDTVWLDVAPSVGIEDQQAALPVTFELQQNYPNPFNPATTIRYGLPEEGPVRLEVFNLSGSSVAVLVDGPQASGYYSVRFEAADLSSGIYFYRLKAGRTEIIRKMTLIK